MEETMESLVDEDHADRLRTRLAVLCNNKDLCDVVLTSADGCDVQAHWLVLASSSEHFAAMRFSPIIYTDLDISELSVIVNYIYTGKVSIIPEKKDKLLQGSKKLKLNSLVSLILNSCNTIAISCPQNQEIDEAFKSIPNQSIESQHKKQSPNLLHAWTKHNKSGTSISSGLSERGSDGAGVDGQCRSDGSSVQFPVGLVQNVSSIESAPLSVSQVSATQSHSRNQIAPVEPHPVAWNWDLQTSDMAEGSQNEMTPHKLIENVDYKIKEEVLSEEEHNFTFFAPPETETEPLQGDSVPPRTPFNGGPGGSPGGARERKRRTRGETDSGSRMVSETVSTTNGGEEAKEADKRRYPSGSMSSLEAIHTNFPPNMPMMGLPYDRLRGRHYLQKIVPVGRKTNITRVCIVCSSADRKIHRMEPEAIPKKRKRFGHESSYECDLCSIALCVEPCFKLYHTACDFMSAYIALKYT